MGDWALHDGQQLLATGIVATTSRYVQLAAAATDNTKGAWATLIAAGAVTYEATGLALSGRMTANSLNHLIDIGIGDAASEVVVVENLLVCSSVAASPWNLQLPIRIPAGVRVAFRHQCSTLSSTFVLGCRLLGGGFASQQPLSRATTYGANTTTSGGVSIDPGAVANTKGTWVELEDVTPNPIKSLAMLVGTQKNAASSTADFMFDVAVGAASSEVVVVPDLYVRAQTANNLAPSALGPYPVTIPAGVRLAVRSQTNITDATDRLLDVVLVGLG